MEKVPPKRLPPTDNSITLHVMSCCYQLHVLILKTCGTSIQECLATAEFGYESFEGAHGRMAVRPLLMSQSATLHKLL